MTETMQTQGRIIGTELGKEGTTNNRAWTVYKYMVEVQGQKLYFSSFKLYEHQLGDYVNIEYTEKPNPTNDKFPYKTIENMEKGVQQEQVIVTPPQTIQGANLLAPVAAPAAQFTMTPAEIGIYNKLLVLPAQNLTKENFIVTMMDNCNMDRARGEAIYAHYLEEKAKP